MLKNKKHLQLMTLLSALFLSGCGGGDDSSDPSDAVTLNSVTITGTGSPVNNVIPINPGVNGGEIQIAWSTSADSYHISAYVSEDDVLNGNTGNDVEVMSLNCGLPFSRCDKNGNESCTFNNNNSMECSINGAKNISTLLDVIPKSAYLIIEVCNALFDKCTSQAKAVEFQ